MRLWRPGCTTCFKALLTSPWPLGMSDHTIYQQPSRGESTTALANEQAGWQEPGTLPMFSQPCWCALPSTWPLELSLSCPGIWQPHIVPFVSRLISSLCLPRAHFQPYALACSPSSLSREPELGTPILPRTLRVLSLGLGLQEAEAEAGSRLLSRPQQCRPRSLS